MLRQRPAAGLSLQVGLIVLPLLVLLLVGIYFLRQDKRLAQSDARDRATELARQIMVQFKSAETNFANPEFFTNSNSWPEDEAFFQIGASGDLIFPPPLQTNRSFEPLVAGVSPAVSNLWVQAEEAEFVQKNSTAALNNWRLLSATNLPPRAAAVIDFNLAVLLEHLKKESEANEIFRRLQSIPVSERLESGLPIAHVAALKSLEAQPGKTNAILETGWKFISEPTEFSPFLLDQLGNERESKARLKLLWNQQELARRLYTAAAGNSNTRSDSRFFGKRFLIEGTNWWLFKSSANIFARSETGMKDLARANITSLNIPTYLSAAIFSDGQWLYSSGSAGRERLLSSLVAQENGNAEAERVEVYLINADLLYARQHQRALWLGALLALSTIVACAGLVHTTRSHFRQQRLNELKSNFVSSVSHELRAPLASIRLMSEGLQSGRIQDQEKQREYFNYLVQECRRLSVLVENILDFSRIDQNKRIYEFEPIDLREVILAAIKTMSPVAADRQVKLEFTNANSAEDSSLNADALALQQAIVNLLDNAIKHSPSGEIVSVSLQHDHDHFRILVRDKGSGVPANERERIFERFYRLGSELRRETPGVGIGLSIVKHIAEAHRGTVRVEDSSGPGALFILSLPKNENR